MRRKNIPGSGGKKGGKAATSVLSNRAQLPALPRVPGTDSVNVLCTEFVPAAFPPITAKDTQGCRAVFISAPLRTEDLSRPLAEDKIEV